MIMYLYHQETTIKILSIKGFRYFLNISFASTILIINHFNYDGTGIFDW